MGGRGLEGGSSPALLPNGIAAGEPTNLGTVGWRFWVLGTRVHPGGPPHHRNPKTVQRFSKAARNGALALR